MTLVNKTGVTLHSLSLSPAKATTWGNNLLREPLRNGKSSAIPITLTMGTLIWDLKIGDKNAAYIAFYAIDFTDHTTTGVIITLTYDSKSNMGAYTLTTS